MIRECSHCKADGSWRCKSCIGHPLLCTQCCRDTHQASPFHRVQSWNGTFYEDAWLYQAGVCLYFGHKGNKCPAAMSNNDAMATRTDNLPDLLVPDEEMPLPDPDADQHTGDYDYLQANKDPTWTARQDAYGHPFILVVDRSGMHLLPAIWCQCHQHVGHEWQALDLQLYPASGGLIRTVFTFECLDDFLAESQECNTSHYHYIAKLRRFTNPIFPDTVPVCKP